MGYKPKKTTSIFEREATLMSDTQRDLINTFKSIARRSGLNDTDAQDIAQHVFCKVLKSIKKNGVQENHDLKRFLVFTFRQSVGSHLKGTTPTISTVMNDDGIEEDLVDLLPCHNNPNPLRLMSISQMFDVVNEVLADENQVVKDIWALHEKQYKYKEISEILNLKMSTVASHIKRVRDQVNMLLKERELAQLFDGDEKSLGKDQANDDDEV
jgi:RNA polymerase sigma factor (sigma-70 family)